MKEGKQETLHLVRPDGSLIRGDINPGWVNVIDGDWSIDGQHLVIDENSKVGDDEWKQAFYYFDAEGNLTGQPSVP